jgi:glycosyltransferase involved in cell wall biosynthesis
MTRLGIVTSGFPYTSKETFLGPELHELSSAADVFVYPVTPKTGRINSTATNDQMNSTATNTPVRMPLVGAHVIAEAAREFVERPTRVARAFRAVALAGASWKVRFKNAAVFAKALAVARDMRRRRIQHVHAYWASTPATVAYAVAMLNDIPWSFTAHRWDIYENNLLADKVRHAVFVRAISERARATVLERVDPAHAHKVTALHLGVARASTFAFESARPFTVLCAANLEPVKGHSTLIRALRLLAERGVDVRCVLAGNGSLRGGLEDAVRAGGLCNRVTFAGAVPHKTLLHDLASGAYDVAVLASIETKAGLHEGIPAFLMEAMAAGVPCIATRTGSIAELIDARCGVLVEQRDAQGLADAIERLANDGATRRALGRAACARVARDFAAETLARRLLAQIQVQDSAAMRREIAELTSARS